MNITRWSHSTLATVLDGCTWQAWLDKAIGAPSGPRDHPRSAAGTAIHAGIELHERRRRLHHYTRGRHGDPSGCVYDEAVQAALDELAGCDVAWDAASYDKAVAEVHAGMDSWWNAPIPDGQPGAGGTMRQRVLAWRPVTIEERWTVWAPEYTARPIVGAADGVYLDELGDVVIVDIKTAKDFRRYDHDGSKQRLQAAMYAWAAGQSPLLPARPGVLPRVEFHVARVTEARNTRFEPCRVVAVQPDVGDVELIGQRLAAADAIIAAGRVDKNPEWFLCKPEWCQHHVDAGGTCAPEAPREWPVDVSGEPLPMVPLRRTMGVDP